MIVNDLIKALYLSAFKGELSCHASSDSNVEECIKCLLENKKINEKEVKRRKINSDMDTELYDIPKNWKWVKLGLLCDVVRGLTFASSQKEKNENNILVLRGGNIDSQTEKILYDDNIYVDKNIPNDNQYLKTGDTLIVASSGTKTSVGKSAYIDKIDSNVSFGGFMMVVRPYSEIVHPKYISYNIKSYRNKIINGTNGFISNVTNEILNNLMIPLPPIEEQQRIVDKIEELFRKLDEIKPLEEELDIIKNKFTNDIKKSILFNAFSENFSQENNSTDEITIKEQLKNIELERDKYYNKNRIKYKKTKIGPIYLTDDNYKLPNNWVYTSLKECSICIFSGKSPQYSKTKNNNAIIGQQVNQEDKCHFEYLKYGTEEFVSNIPKYQYLTQNDVLLNTLGGGSVGRVGLFNFDKEYLTDGHIFVIRTNGLTVEKYIMYFLRLFRSKIEDIANGTTNQKFLNLSQVENFMIPLPSLEEQQRIVDEIEKLLPICDDIDKIINI